MNRWLVFIRERFEPLSHLLMIGALFGANLSLTRAFIFSPPLDAEGQILRLVVCFVVSVLFFFHLRLFDELKDYKTDLEVNRDRPLPRGLIKIPEYKLVMTGVIVAELLLSYFVLGLQSVLALGIAVIYSLLMFKEFFVGPWIRPKMELYAISHTLVSGFVALFVAVSTSQSSLADVPTTFLLVMALNWMIFNVFEFARKTFAPDEERPHVESYSSRWGLFGGCLWTFSFVFLAYAILYRLNTHLLGWDPWFLNSTLLVSLAVIGAGIALIIQKSSRSAKLFRHISSFYLVFFNLLIAIGFF